MRRLEHGWRLIATGLNFALFGVGALVISCTFFPLVHLISGRKKLAQRRCRYLVHISFKLFIALMRWLGVITYEIDDVERLRNRHGKVIIANHPSLIDIVFIISLVPRAQCVVKKAAWSNPFLRGVVQSAGYIQNDAPDELLRSCSESLEEGNNLIIFPEGTRTVVGQPLRLQRGAAAVIARSGKFFIPLIITCWPTMLTKAEKWYQIPPRRGHFKISVGQEMDWQSLVADGMAPGVVNRHLTRSIQDIFEEGIARHEQHG